MAEYDIYREKLAIKHPSYGHALWEPNPRKPDRPVQVGDVGFIRQGRFYSFFNILLPADDPSHEFGVPEYHEPLVPTFPEHLDTKSLSCNHYCSAGVEVESDPGYHSGPSDFRQVSLQYKGTRGAAVLSLPVAARREDTIALGDFKRWILKHIDIWFAFARKLGLGIELTEEIILVTGCDRTRSWANVAFLGNYVDAQVSFGVQVEGPDTRINFQFSPEDARGAVPRHGPEGTNLPENQCVFIRGFRVARTLWILPRRLKAAAGPPPDLGGYDCDDTEVISIPAVTKYRDPLHLLLEYIAEQVSDCDMVLAHDDDLVTIDGLGHDSSLETLEPDVMMDLLRRSNIEIDKVSCDASRTDSVPRTDTSVVKVAMVSMKLQNRDIGSQSDWLPQSCQNVDHTPALLEHQQWIPDGGSGLGGGGVGRHPQISSGYNSNISRRPAPVTSMPDAKKCRIPDCAYNAYYNVFEQEQSEYCGHAHELQAVTTGLVASCTMCKERPRRTNERVCGRTCGERDRHARQVQGTYYGVPVVRREPLARPGA